MAIKPRPVQIESAWLRRQIGAHIPEFTRINANILDKFEKIHYGDLMFSTEMTCLTEALVTDM